MNKLCCNCRYWQRHGHTDNREGFCRLNMSHIPHMIEFSAVETRGNGYHTHPSVWAKHDEVRTSPDFGCNQWEKSKR